MPVRSRMRVRQRLLVRPLDRAPVLLEGASSACASSALSRDRSVTQPSPTVSSSRRASAGLLSTMKRRGVTPLVTLWNRSGHSSAKSRSTVCLQQRRVQRRHAVHRVAADGGQVRHAHALSRPLRRSATSARRAPRRPG